MRDVGYVTEENGVIGVRATFKKRYITLAPVAGIVGLAFNLKVRFVFCLWEGLKGREGGVAFV